MKHFKYIILFAVALFSSCEDKLLNLKPLDQVSDETFFSNEEELQLALNAAYGQMTFAFAEGMALQQYMESTLTDNSLFRITDELLGTQALSNSVHNSSTSFDGIYSGLYKSIGRANKLLQNMHRAKENTSEVSYNDIQAQALTIRAYLYDYLVMLFGDVPFLQTVPDNVADAFIARTPKSEIITQILLDLDEAASLVKTDLKGSQERITQTAIYGVKARIALNNNLYDVAKDAADKSLSAAKEQGVELYSDYQKLFTEQGEGASEILLRKPYNETWQQSNFFPLRMGDRFGNFCQLLPTQNLIDSYITINGLSIDKDPTYDPKDPWSNRDPRMRASIVFPQDSWGGRIYESHRDSLETTDAKGKRISNLNCRSVSWPAGLTGYLWKKYVDSTAVVNRQTTGYNDLILFRLGEVYLIKAEAEIELNKDLNAAAEAINKLRARAWKDDSYPRVKVTTQSEMRKILRIERRSELTMEGIRYFDMLRWRIAEKARKEPLLGRVFDVKNATFIPRIDEDGIVYYSNRSEYDDWKSLLIGGEVVDDAYEPKLYGNWQNAVERNFTAPRDYLLPIPLREIELYESVGKTLTQNSGY